MNLLREELRNLEIEKLDRKNINDALYNLNFMIKMETDLKQKIHFHDLKIKLLNKLISLDKAEFGKTMR